MVFPQTGSFSLFLEQVWGISETHNQNYRLNARPRLRLADLLTEVVILQLRPGSEL